MVLKGWMQARATLARDDRLVLDNVKLLHAIMLWQLLDFNVI